jgi:hypothetical protein
MRKHHVLRSASGGPLSLFAFGAVMLATPYALADSDCSMEQSLVRNAAAQRATCEGLREGPDRTRCLSASAKLVEIAGAALASCRAPARRPAPDAAPSTTPAQSTAPLVGTMKSIVDVLQAQRAAERRREDAADDAAAAREQNELREKRAERLERLEQRRRADVQKLEEAFRSAAGAAPVSMAKAERCALLKTMDKGMFDAECEQKCGETEYEALKGSNEVTGSLVSFTSTRLTVSSRYVLVPHERDLPSQVTCRWYSVDRPVELVARNDSSRPMRLRVRWSASFVPRGEMASRLAFDRPADCTVPANSTIVCDKQAVDSSMGIKWGSIDVKLVNLPQVN